MAVRSASGAARLALSDVTLSDRSLVASTDAEALPVTGTLAITSFAIRQGQLAAIGTLTATVRDAAGNIVQTIIRQMVIQVSTITGTCQILHLELGPLDLNLLGLMIHLDKIVLDITAQAGGGLLGNLLCAIANLLNTNTLGQQLVNLLNQLLGALSTL